MKRRFLLAIAMVAITATCRNRPATPPPSLADLAWSGPKQYSTGSTAIAVNGFGINDLVDVLPAGPLPLTVSVTRDLTNAGSMAAPAGYSITDTVVAMRLSSTGSAIGFVPVTGAAVASLATPGPALAPGDTTTVGFTFAIGACGLYRETLRADAGNAVAESNETNNVGVHYFAVPGTQRVNITVASNNVDIWHAPAGPKPAFAAFLPATLPFTVHAFTITAATPGTTFYYNYRTAPITGVFGAVARFAGPPPVQPPAAPVTGPITINLQLNSVVAHSVPLTDILLDLSREQLSGKVTAITADGCSIRQDSKSFSVFHPAG